jgi:chaperonin GroES
MASGAAEVSSFAELMQDGAKIVAFERGANPSGIHPIEHKVLIDPTPIEEKIGSIIIPDTTKDQEKFAQIKGRIVAVSPHAFNYESKESWAEANAEKPGPGALVLYAKYAGVRVKGKNGKEYLLVNDQDICATVED